jgi:membrane protein insertase, YidC/Oxa1 family, C-terminal domain
MHILDFIAYPLGKFLYFIYNTLGFHYYGLAIIIFTVVVKLVLLPLTVKQYKSTSKMQVIQPQIQEIQKRYKNDKEKLNQEMMKVYQENSVNPAGGCLPLLVQMPILISLYWVIVQPLKFMLSKTPEQITKIVDVASKAMKAAGDTINTTVMLGSSKELSALNYFNSHKNLLDQLGGNLKANELINFHFLGLDLGIVPTYKTALLFGPNANVYLPLLILPILAVVTTFLSTKISMPKTNNNNTGNQNAMASSMTNSMMYIGPVMTLIFSFQLPAGVILYWTIGYVFQIFQQLYINKHILKRNEPVEIKKPLIEPATQQAGKKEIGPGNGGKNSGNRNNGNKSGKKKEGKKK